MYKTLTITLPKTTQNRLQRLALQYGLSITELSQHVLEEVSSSIPEESFSEYSKPRALQASLQRGLKDWQSGRVHTTL